MTANSKTLTERHLASVGIHDIPYQIIGMENGAEFTNFTVQNWQQVNVENCRKELIDAACELASKHNIGAFVLECTNMAPYANDIQKSTGIPVFDIVTLVNMFYRAFNPQKF